MDELDDEQEARVRDDLRETRDNADMQWLLDHEQGRRILWKILARSGYLDIPATLDPYEMACHQGSRAVGRHFFDHAMARNKDALAILMAENEVDPLRDK